MQGMGCTSTVPPAPKPEAYGVRGRAKRDAALECLGIKLRLDAKAKAPSPLRSVGALQMVALTRRTAILLLALAFISVLAQLFALRSAGVLACGFGRRLAAQIVEGRYFENTL